MRRLNSEKIMNVLKNTVIRFPLTMIFVFILTIWQFIEEDFFFTYEHTFLLLVTGILLSATSQLLYEQLFRERPQRRWLLYGGVILFVILYHIYLTSSYSQIDDVWGLYSIPGIRTMILYFVTIILFTWVPTIRSKYTFSESFLVTFKAYFSTSFFSLVLFLGVLFIVLLFEFLFFSLEIDWFKYSTILIFYTFSPILFLTFIPAYYLEDHTTDSAARTADEAIQVPKFLHHLISYILVPIMAILTAIIVAYILTNIGGAFFAENILEGLLLNYTISGWILLIIADQIDNKMVRAFKKIFPISLLFVIIFQMISTFLQIREVGVTHGRYIILLFGVGSIISGIWYLLKQERLKILPIVAMVAGLIALIPPIDAMSVSVSQQKKRINEILERNGMMVDSDYVIPNPAVPEEDQEQLQESFDYLSDIRALNQLEWLPEEHYASVDEYLGFNDGEGFTEPGDTRERESRIQTAVSLEGESLRIPVGDFEQVFHLSLNSDRNTFSQSFPLNGEEYEIDVAVDDELIIRLNPSGVQGPLEFDFTYVLEEFADDPDLVLPQEELTFTQEVDNQQVQIIIKWLYVRSGLMDIEFYVLL